MKQILLSGLFLLQALAFQAQTTDASIDAYAASFTCEECATLEVFTKALTEPYADNKDKARVIFAWVAQHVRYDYAKFKKIQKQKTITFTGATKQEVERKQRLHYEELVPNKTFKTKKGVCEDYSYLYKKMCDIAGLECIVVTGLTKHLSAKVSNIGHAWNAVRIDGQWRLLDATWGAGYIDERSRFRRHYSPGYFMTPPAFFALNHLPADPQWQLLDTPIDKQGFRKQYWLNYGQQTYPIIDIQMPDAAALQGASEAELRIKFAQKPPVIWVNNRSDKPVPFKESTADDGYTVLKVNKRSKEVLVYGGAQSRGRVTGLALGKFYLDGR